jgi:tRNA pseudouridine55 synthase
VPATAPPPADAVVVVDKPAGMTSHAVVSRVRRIAGTRKVGHAGTLDPMATGVLVLGVGRATRLLGHLMTGIKGYEATIRLGESTSTDDAEGESLAVVDATGLDPEDVTTALRAFVGDIEQRPSAVSAIKVDGQRAYARVRAGEQVDLPARPVTVESIDVREVRTLPPYVDVELSVTCSAGTYVRAIARDLGEALGVGGHLTMLRRTRVGQFTLDGARTLEELQSDYRPVSLSEAARRLVRLRRGRRADRHRRSGTVGRCRTEPCPRRLWWHCSTRRGSSWRCTSSVAPTPGGRPSSSGEA